MTVAGIEVSSTDKVFFPEAGLTKGDLIDYYDRISDVMLPHLRDRPLTLHRYPDGLEGESFLQKDTPDYFPDWIERVTVEKEGGQVTHVLCQDRRTLVYLANQASITLHVWLSRADQLHDPDRLVFDLDPPGDDPEPARAATRQMEVLLEELGLPSFLMSTGSRGFHVVVPLDRSEGFDEVRAFARRCAQLVSGRHPDDLTTETRKAARKGRVFVDYLRNAYAQTAVCPYSVRARPGASVALPLDWDELAGTHPRKHTIGTVFRRLGQKDDPWADIGAARTSLAGARDRLEELEEDA